MANIRKVGARNKVSSRGKLYNMSDMLSESYRALFDCEKDSKLYKLVESHIQSLKQHPTELSIHSKNLTVIKGLMLKEASDLDIRLSDLKESDPDFDDEAIIEEDEDEVEEPAEEEDEEPEEAEEEEEPAEEEEEIEESEDEESKDDEEIEESEEEEEEIDESSDPEEEDLEEDDELTPEELEELSNHLKEMRKARKMKEAEEAKEEESEEEIEESEEELEKEEIEESEEDLEEAEVQPIMLDITSATKPLSNQMLNEIFSKSVNGIEVRPLRDDICTPWDADIKIENGDLILFGSLVAGGAGTATARIPLSRAYRYWEFQIMPNSPEDADDIGTILMQKGWIPKIEDCEDPEASMKKEVEEGCGTKKMKESKKKGFLKKLKSR